MHAIDTNVLVRLIVRDDENQVRIAEAFAARGVWISHLVLAEAIWVLDAVYDRSPAQIAASLAELLNHESLVLQDSDVVAAALELFRKRPVLKFSDCLIVEIARKGGHLPVGTFDRNLAKIDDAQRLG